MTREPWKYDEPTVVECDVCGEEFETNIKTPLCPLCEEEAYHESVARSARRGGW